MLGTADHIGIAVKDIEKSILFFEEIFGLELLRKKTCRRTKVNIRRDIAGQHKC